ncbi:MAG: PEP-CTERM sorting domain-containing protein [Gemmatimonadetes bacterium]|nr:PEP-CTERM sorting domain-containing protein [Gemmatimonadota bacterium]
MTRSLRSLVLSAALLTATSVGAGAQTTTPFGGVNFSCSNASYNPASSCFSYIWNQNDYWKQSQVTGPMATGKLSLNLWYTYGLNSAPSASFDVLLNGTGVGNFQLSGPATVLGYQSFDFFFSPIIANSFDVQIVWSGGSAPPGGGSVGIYTTDFAPYERYSDVTLDVVDPSTVPEPATLALLAPGLLAVGVIARRRAKRNA